MQVDIKDIRYSIPAQGVLLSGKETCRTQGNYAMSCRATQVERVIVKSSDKLRSTGGGNVNLLQYSCQENPVNSMKRQRDMTPGDELPRSEGFHYGTGEEWRAITYSSRKNEMTGPKQK